jgi:hypothetical protein
VGKAREFDFRQYPHRQFRHDPLIDALQQKQ